MVLFVAAEAREFRGLLHRVKTRRLDWPVDFAHSGEIGGQPAVLVANGPGPRLANEAVETACRFGTPRAMVSTGLCGALSPQLALGEIVVADRVLDVEHALEYAGGAVASSRSYTQGPLISLDRVLASASDKRSFKDAGAIAVEMEAAAVAASASVKRIPFYCVRSVSDTANEDLVLDFNEFRDADGRFSQSGIVAAALRRPWTRIPGLIRLGRNSQKAAEALGDFLVDCRF